MENNITNGGKLPSRTLAQITESAKMHVQGAGQNLLQLGQDMLDAKALLGHGQWMPWLQEIGQKPRTAENLMRLAREIPQDSKLAALPYTKALAVLALPEGERESFVEEHEDKSALEIKRLILERDQLKRERDVCAAASEKANARAAKAEKDLYDEQHKLPERIEVKVVPDDYHALKKQAEQHQQELDEAVEAAEDAERRAEAAERELQQLRISGVYKKEDPVSKAANKLNDFLIIAQMFPYQREIANLNRSTLMDMVQRMEGWCRDMHTMLDGQPLQAEEVNVS